MEENFPPPLTPVEAAELQRRQRGKNWALLIALFLLAGLLYAISMVKFKVS